MLVYFHVAILLFDGELDQERLIINNNAKEAIYQYLLFKGAQLWYSELIVLLGLRMKQNIYNLFCTHHRETVLSFNTMYPQFTASCSLLR